MIKSTLVPIPAGYSTLFPLTENPIVEDGGWIQQATSWTKVRTSGGIAFGTNGAADTYDDSYAYRSGFGANHRCTGVLAVGTPTGANHEVELLLRWFDDASTAHGYECLLSHEGSIQIMRIDGFATFEQLAAGSNSITPVSGDTFMAQIVGSTIEVYYNAVLQASANINSFSPVYSTGQPGMGFFKRPTGNNSDFGFTSFAAVNL